MLCRIIAHPFRNRTPGASPFVVVQPDMAPPHGGTYISEPINISAQADLWLSGGQVARSGDGAHDHRNNLIDDRPRRTCYALCMAFWLETYQTIVVGVVGFAGVICTIRFNAKNARNERRAERDHERDTLRVALIAELKINRRTLTENTSTLRECSSDPESKAFIPTDPMNHAYLTLVPRIGLLSEDEVSKVMEAYLTLETLDAKLFLLGVPVPTSPRHVDVPGTNLRAVAQMQESVVPLVEAAIDALKMARRVH